MAPRQLDFRSLQLAVERKSPDPIYLLVGNEPYLFTEAIKLLKDKVLEGGASDFNFDSYFAPDTNAAHVRDVVETLPMMSARRIVIYRDIDKLKEKDWEILAPILEQPIDSCLLILTAESIDKRKKQYKRLLEQGQLVELNSPYDNQIPAWIEYIGFGFGLEVSREARLLIQQFVGVNLTEIQNELRKLRDFIAPRKNVEAEDVLQAVTRSKINSIFELTKAIGSKDTATALTLLAQLLEQGQNEVGVVAMVSRHMRILTGVRNGLREGLSGPKLSAKVGVANFFLKEYVDQARAWTEDKLNSTLEALYETDKALKSSPVSSHIWLENLILKTCES